MQVCPPVQAAWQVHGACSHQHIRVRHVDTLHDTARQPQLLLGLLGFTLQKVRSSQRKSKCCRRQADDRTIWSVFGTGSARAPAMPVQTKQWNADSEENITVVESAASAAQVVSLLKESTIDCLAISYQLTSLTPSQKRNGKEEEVLCLAMYAGDKVPLVSGPFLYIDATCDEAADVLKIFREVFEREDIPKAYHNYSQMMTVLYRIYGDDFRHGGFSADVMHLGRLADANRPCTLVDMSQNPNYQVGLPLFNQHVYFDVVKPQEDDLEDGVPIAWKHFACMHSFVIFQLRYSLQRILSDTPLIPQGLSMYDSSEESKTMWDFYLDYWLEFAQVIEQMQHEGVAVSSEYLKKKEMEAKAEREQFAQKFFGWVNKRSTQLHGHGLKNIRFLKFGSDNMLRVLLFSDTVSSIPKHANMEVKIPIAEYEEAVGKKTRVHQPVEEAELAHMVQTLDEQGLKEECKKRGLKYGGTRNLLIRRLKDPQEDDYPKRRRVWQPVRVELRTLKLGLMPQLFTGEGKPSVSEPCLKQALAEAYLDEESQAGIELLMKIKDLDHLLSSFLVPLQEHAKRTGRIHSSCNLNTETGRLSSLNPNLQNQPASARYDVRKAFVAAPGNKLVVADYGQLELRVVAHLANCRAMIDALNEGGDFHSRTAVRMYDEIGEAIERGEVVLEEHEQLEGSSIPLVKEKYGALRRKAKTLNFSILYGKTATGLAKDWGIERHEAKETIERWFRAYPEIKVWQQSILKDARKERAVRTLFGRLRPLPQIRDSDRRIAAHGERCAINTPVQGGAADIVTSCMLRIHRSEKLLALGYKLLLQIHDEVIIEGPAEHAVMAKQELENLMEHPFLEEGVSMKAYLTVDAKVCDNWADGKD